MKKKNGSLAYQINQKLQGLKRFGQSRHEAKQAYRASQEAKGEKWNPAKAEGIFSFKTYDAYKQTAMEFSKWLRENHSDIKTLDQISQEHAIRYLQGRQAEGKSAYTVSKDMSAINKIFGTELSKKNAGLAERSYKNVTRSRGIKAHDKQYNPANYKDQIAFAKGTGCRRSSVHGGKYSVKPCSLWKDSEGNLYVSLIEKGGRFRNTKVLDAYKGTIEGLVTAIPVREPLANLKAEGNRFRELYRASSDSPLFEKYPLKIDNHAFRAEYARARYQELAAAKQAAGGSVSNDYRGYDKSCIMGVSKDLGHGRPSVVVEHYMR